MHISDRARHLHDRGVIVDAHNDSLIQRLADQESLDLTVRDERYDFDIPRALEGGLTCSFVTGGDAHLDRVGGSTLDQAMALFDGTSRLAEEHADQVIYATCVADIERAKAEGKLALMSQLESCTCLNGSLATLRNLYRLGLRVANLTHGEGGEGTTQIEASIFDYTTPADREAARRGAGLTDFGREVIAECNRIGIIIDLAHATDASFFEAVELSAAPPIFSHGAVFAQSPHWRGLTDDQLRALAQAGGVIGIAFHPLFIDREAPSMRRLIDSFAYVIDLVGPDHAGIGADYDGMSSYAGIPPAIEHLREFTQALVARGFDDETVLKVLGGNFMRVMGEVIG